MSAYDWSRFAQKSRIKVPVQKVYDAWTTRNGLESWFLRTAEFQSPEGVLRPDDEYVKQGDSYRWQWHGYPDEVEEKGEVLEANGKDRFKFTFGKAGVVTVTMQPEDEHTIMEIVQEDIPTDEESIVQYHIGCQTGWSFYRANIKAVLEGTSDARNIGYNDSHCD